MHDFRKLEVWKKSRELVKVVYTIANHFPNQEMFGLTSQIKRSAISIPSNIAEGCGRDSKKQLLYHLNVALGSSFELETQIVLASDLTYISNGEKIEIVQKIQEVEKMISGLMRSNRV